MQSITDAIYYPVSQQKMVRGEHIYLYDENGNRYIDCGAGTFNLSLGYSHPAVIAAMQKQSELAIHISSSFQTDVINDLTRQLVALSPPNLSMVHLKVSSGSTANEGAIKMAQVATGRTEVITLFRSHLGQTVTMAGLSGNAFRREPFPLRPPGGIQVPDPYCYRCFYAQHPDRCGLMCVDRIEDFIEYASSGRVAAIIVEPISGNGGNVVAPPGYLAKLRQFCDEREIILIFDEVQTGIGRTGQMFAADHFGVRPDALTIGKGLGGSGAAIAGILVDQKLSGMAPEHHSFTYGANLMAAAAARTTLEIVSQPPFLANVREIGDFIMARLRDAQRRFPAIGDVRGVGLMIGVELVDRDGSPAVAVANAMAREAMAHGLLLRTSRYGHGNVVKIRPPLVLSRSEAEVICDRFEETLRTVTT